MAEISQGMEMEPPSISTPLQQHEAKRKRPSSSQNNETELLITRRKKPKKKIYRPKVIGEGKKRKIKTPKTPLKQKQVSPNPKTPPNRGESKPRTRKIPPLPKPTTQKQKNRDFKEIAEIKDDQVNAIVCCRDLVLVENGWEGEEVMEESAAIEAEETEEDTSMSIVIRTAVNSTVKPLYGSFDLAKECKRKRSSRKRKYGLRYSRRKGRGSRKNLGPFLFMKRKRSSMIRRRCNNLASLLAFPVCNPLPRNVPGRVVERKERGDFNGDDIAPFVGWQLKRPRNHPKSRSSSKCSSSSRDVNGCQSPIDLNADGGDDTHVETAITNETKGLAETSLQLDRIATVLIDEETLTKGLAKLSLNQPSGRDITIGTTLIDEEMSLTKPNGRDTNIGTTLTNGLECNNVMTIVEGKVHFFTVNQENPTKVSTQISLSYMRSKQDLRNMGKDKLTKEWLHINHFLTKLELINGISEKNLFSIPRTVTGSGGNLIMLQQNDTHSTRPSGNENNLQPTLSMVLWEHRREGINNNHKQSTAIVPHPKLLKKKEFGKIYLDPRDITMWKLLIENDSSEKEKIDNEWWENERKVFRGRINAFNAMMHVILGDRRFSPWKGSVVDSVVGVFLTQNVSDHLSSSAYLSLAATFPLPEVESHTKNYHDKEILSIQPSAQINEILCESKWNSDSMMKTNKAITDNAISSQGCLGSSGLDLTLSLSTCLEEEKDTDNSKEKAKKSKIKQEVDWNSLREKWDSMRKHHVHEPRSRDHMDSVDWEAVRTAEPIKIADAIKERGQHNIIAGRIKEFLDRTTRIHGCIDLEWLRHAPSKDVKEYLLEIDGLGLKSVECIRLLALQQIAFPVDINVGRIAVRLGWVPLEPLPEEVQMHLLETFPMMDSIQKYLWPRLNMLDQRTLYELHYQLITFGKVFCTKRKPNCNACPLRADCRHYASAYASARLALPGVSDKGVVSTTTPNKSFEVTARVMNPTLLHINDNPCSGATYKTNNCEPIIEEPSSPEPAYDESQLTDIEDLCAYDSDNVPIIRIRSEKFTTSLNCVVDNINRALVPVHTKVASLPMRKLKHVDRLRTEHQAYELPDTHPLLSELEKRESNDPCPYLLCILSPGETIDSSEPPNTTCTYRENKEICTIGLCSLCNIIREQNNGVVRGTILIPCRTATRGKFPLNGTYFQVNEVFADDETSKNPIHVPREWIWDLPRRTTYFGTSTTTIFRGLAMEEIQYCFQKGFICVRGFNRRTRTPKRLAERLHRATNASIKARTNKNGDRER